MLLFFVTFFRDKTGKFPDYPDDDEGGSAAIFKEKDPGEVSALLNCFSVRQPTTT